MWKFIKRNFMRIVVTLFTVVNFYFYTEFVISLIIGFSYIVNFSAKDWVVNLLIIYNLFLILFIPICMIRVFSNHIKGNYCDSFVYCLVPGFFYLFQIYYGFLITLDLI